MVDSEIPGIVVAKCGPCVVNMGHIAPNTSRQLTPPSAVKAVDHIAHRHHHIVGMLMYMLVCCTTPRLTMAVCVSAAV